MPYTIVKTDDMFQLRNKNTKKLLGKKFRTRASAKKFADRYESKKKTVPKGSHRMPDGSIMKNSAMKKSSY